MTAAVFRSGTPALSIPQTQNTAPVLEFNCLYTHDVRRKQKRWQDGFLRFHTFNKRVMVYDVPRNFIGDTHWKAEEPLQDGDEVTLEKGGVIVQVAESIGATETDLTELRKSKNKTSSEKGSSSPIRAMRTPDPRVLNGSASKPATQLKHRSLNAVLGASKGPIGKAALPTKSPFEQRQADAENEQWENGRPPKRQRIADPPPWNVTRTSAASPFLQKEAPLWARTSDSRNRQTKRPLEAGQQRLGTKEIIDLSAETDELNRPLPGISSDAVVPPSSPVKEQPLNKSLVRSSSPAFQTQKAPIDEPRRESKATSNSRSHGDERRRYLPESDSVQDEILQPPKSRASEGKSKSTKDTSPSLNPPVAAPPNSFEFARPTSSKSGKTLRMAASGPKKKTLLCQDQLSKKPSRVYSTNTENAIETLLDAASQDLTTEKQQPGAQRQQLQERLARISKKNLAEQKDHSDVGEDHSDFTTQGLQTAVRGRAPISRETIASELAQLDQMIMPPTHQPQSEAVELPQPKDRELRRVVSEANSAPSLRARRAPGAPVRFTPTPSPTKKSPVPIQPQQIPAAKPAPALPQTRAKQPMQRTVSLNTRPSGTSTVILGRPFQAPKPPAKKLPEAEQAANAWSREAFDLFTWRPLGWDEENWRVGATNVTADTNG